MTAKKLDLRTEPKQSRALNRVDTILAVTEKMLSNGEKISTSAIAKKAGIPVGSVYRYFPDVHAIYQQLFESINGNMLDRVKAEFEHSDPDANWQQIFKQCMDIMRNTYETNPAFGDLLLKMDSPEIRASKARVTEDIAKALAARWRGGHDNFSGDDPDSVARTVVEMATANELSYFLESDQHTRDKLYVEWMRAIAAYLNLYLGP